MVAALVAAGCGGSSDEEVTKAEFIKEADAVCRQAEKVKREKMEGFLAQSSAGEEKPLKLSELQEMATKAILPSMRSMVDGLSELPTPSEDDGKGEQIVADFDEITTELEENPLPLATGKPDPFEPIAKEAEKYGFKTCILYYS